MILGVCLIAIGISNAFTLLGIEINEGQEPIAIGLGAFFVVVGLVMSWYRAVKEAERNKPPEE